MNIVNFSAAKAVWFSFSSPVDRAVDQYGFYYALDLSHYASDDECIMNGLSINQVIMRITARTTYRLYINGDIVMYGPARTAHGYCRIDEIDVTDHLIPGVNHVAVEVVCYPSSSPAYEQYSNSFTMESGLFIAELEADGVVLTATGREDWQVCPIEWRSPVSERISHCRECTEIYTLTDDYYRWRLGIPRGLCTLGCDL